MVRDEKVANARSSDSLFFLLRSISSEFLFLRRFSQFVLLADTVIAYVAIPISRFTLLGSNPYRVSGGGEVRGYGESAGRQSVGTFFRFHKRNEAKKREDRRVVSSVTRHANSFLQVVSFLPMVLAPALVSSGRPPRSSGNDVVFLAHAFRKRTSWFFHSRRVEKKILERAHLGRSFVTIE